MRDNGKWLLGLLTVLAAPASAALWDSYSRWHDPVRRGEVSVNLDALHGGAALVALAGIAASILVVARAPGWWRLVGLPGLLLNTGALLLSSVCA